MLKQSHQFRRVTKAIVCLGDMQSEGERTFFFKNSQGEKLSVLVVYTCDIIINGHDPV